MDAKAFGASGEDMAEKHLKTLGYRILERNYRTQAGELDIIAKDGDVIVFVEVKSRRGLSFGEPELAVNFHKQRQLTRAAWMYLTRARSYNAPCRFDVVGIYKDGGGTKVKVLKDAFELSEAY